MTAIPVHVVVPCILLLLLFIIPSPSHAQTDEKPCIINASFHLYPVHYNGHKRQNPDNTFYPGDAFHYLFAFSGSETCQNFRPHLIESQGGLTLLSHDVFPHGLPPQNYIAPLATHHRKTTTPLATHHPRTATTHLATICLVLPCNRRSHRSTTSSRSFQKILQLPTTTAYLTRKQIAPYMQAEPEPAKPLIHYRRPPHFQSGKTPR